MQKLVLYIYYDIMISRRSKGLKLTLLTLSSTIRERNFDLDSPDWLDVGDVEVMCQLTHLTRLFFKEPIWCEITLNGFEMPTGTISCTFSGTKFNKKSRSAPWLFRYSRFLYQPSITDITTTYIASIISRIYIWIYIEIFIRIYHYIYTKD